MMSLAQASKVLNGTMSGESVDFSAVSIDTRSLKSGDLYVALHGDRFDGHDYIEQAKQAGAVAAIVHKDVNTCLPVIKVENTRKALGELAAAWRQAFCGKVAAITGSNGKTTVKEMLALIAAKQGSVLSTRGNFNNDIGLPLTLLRIKHEDFAVIEMGANHLGEISGLTNITRPDVALINNAGQSHLEGFGSLKGVAQAKGEIFQGLSDDGIGVVNKDDEFSEYWCALLGNKKRIEFSMKDVTADVYGEWHQTESGGNLKVNVCGDELSVNLKVHGMHNAMNALAAIAVTEALSIDHKYIAQALNEFEAVKGRLNFHKVSENLTVIDDTYNANPASLLAGINVLKELPGEHWLVLGDMGELGDDEQSIHFNAGTEAKKSGVARLLAIGESSVHAAQAFGEKAKVFKDKEELISFIRQHQSGKLGVLIKGSRFMHMEQIVESLVKETT